MPTYVVDVQLLGCAHVARCFALDRIMESSGFFPFRPGVPPEECDIGVRFSRWEYAGNQRLTTPALRKTLEANIREKIQHDISLTITRVRITVGGGDASR
jgi:hypothetical protein